MDLVYASEDLSEPRPEEMFMHRRWHCCPHYDMSHSLDSIVNEHISTRFQIGIPLETLIKKRRVASFPMTVVY
jgi:hypothetical protein